LYRPPWHPTLSGDLSVDRFFRQRLFTRNVKINLLHNFVGKVLVLVDMKRFCSEIQNSNIRLIQKYVTYTSCTLSVYFVVCLVFLHLTTYIVYYYYTIANVVRMQGENEEIIIKNNGKRQAETHPPKRQKRAYCMHYMI